MIHNILGGLQCFSGLLSHNLGIGGGLTYHYALHERLILISSPSTDNRPASLHDHYALPDHTVISIQGLDALNFAQAQFANDVVGLADGHWQWNAWLTPKGRVIVLFALLRMDAQSLKLIVPDADSEALVEQLRRFVFRRKLQLSVVSTAYVSGACSAPNQAVGAQCAQNGTAIELDYGSMDQPRCLRISEIAAPTDSTFLSRWKAIDLSFGLPRLSQAQREHWTPHQLSLDRLAAFSVKKGCYPGQEIVARTHFLGKAKRGLRLFQSDVAVNDSVEVRDAQSVVGSIIANAHSGARLVLAVLPIDHHADQYSTAGIPLHELPLATGLAR